jgi:hypothetical protein
MLQFLKVHRGRSRAATPQEALYRVTLAPAQILGLANRLGSFVIGKDFSFVEVAGAATSAISPADADRAILEGLLGSNESELVRYAPGGEFGSAIEALAAAGLPVADELAALTADVERAAAAVEKRITRVTLVGRVAWSRS